MLLLLLLLLLLSSKGLQGYSHLLSLSSIPPHPHPSRIHFVLLLIPFSYHQKLHSTLHPILEEVDCLNSLHTH
ncbi:uncharacterized protein LY79DRAFT_555165 [Colletotrichum navitas]|uniref:Secreted protein n=1 Tax=Colletotrichum navitas TaxID=681940 RepID=A0AAD8PZE4_9PEZI|nr:uncharacterized protein LY79DRAFT_555165 [Colletotrichum navitas]KAK1590380.1 hypothetical protein LY79DRAFT_555165 [Colletotrichum navitas]